MKKFVMENSFFYSLIPIGLTLLFGITLLPLIIIYIIFIHHIIIKPRRKNNNIKISIFLVEWLKLLFWLIVIIVSIPFIWLFKPFRRKDYES